MRHRYQGLYDGASREVARYGFHQQDVTVGQLFSERTRRNSPFFRLAKYQVRAIYCDLELNTLRCVYFNLYTGLLLCGMKMHEHLRTSDIVVPKSTKLILGMFLRWLSIILRLT